MPKWHGNAHSYASRSTAWRSPLKGKSGTRSGTAKSATLTAVVARPPPAEARDEHLQAPPSPKAKRRLDMAKMSISSAPTGRITINDVTLSGQSAGINEFNAKLMEILDSWAVGAEREYRKVTGHRLLLDGNGRSRITERGERLENFYCMCKDMGGARRAYGKSQRQEVHMTLARSQDTGEVIAVLEWVIHHGGLGINKTTRAKENGSNTSTMKSEISQAVSKRVMDKSLPRGVMTALVQYVAEVSLQRGISTIGIKQMHNTAITYWNQCGLDYRGNQPQNVISTIASKMRCELAVDVQALAIGSPSVRDLR